MNVIMGLGGLSLCHSLSLSCLVTKGAYVALCHSVTTTL
jgi:hypothetical protein